MVDELNKRITISPDTVLIDAEAGRIARVIGQFNLFRAWAYAHAGDDGDGRLARSEVETAWLATSIAKGKRQTRCLLKSGVMHGYWTYDKSTKQLYLTGQVNLAQQLVSACLNPPGYCHLVETNKPGKRRVQVDLSGTLQEASAKLYAPWFVAKDTKRTGTTISREMLCDLWQVSVPALLTWESMVAVQKQANYAQSNDTTLKNVPAHAYLTLNRDGTTACAWRLPNTYTVTT